MKRFLLVLALVAVAGATYVATAPGSQTAGPTAKQFKALKKQVAKLQKDEKQVKQLALEEAFLLTTAWRPRFRSASSATTLTSLAGTFGYTYTDPDHQRRRRRSSRRRSTSRRPMTRTPSGSRAEARHAGRTSTPRRCGS